MSGWLPPGCTQADIDRAIDDDREEIEQGCVICGAPVSSGQRYCGPSCEFQDEEGIL